MVRGGSTSVRGWRDGLRGRGMIGGRLDTTPGVGGGGGGIGGPLVSEGSPEGLLLLGRRYEFLRDPEGGRQ